MRPRKHGGTEGPLSVIARADAGISPCPRRRRDPDARGSDGTGRPPRRPCLRAAAAPLWLLSLVAGAAAAQPPASGAPRTTRAGVYTPAQAERGAEVYAGMCRSCHAVASHTGATFARSWKGRTLAELYLYVSEQMPKNDPGGLAPEQYADVVAYLLRLNAMPAGSAELPPDPTPLATIRIDVPDSSAKEPAPVRKDPR